MGDVATERPSELAILVDLHHHGGLRQVGLTASDAVERSAMAVEQAMATIRGMAERVRSTVQELAVRPESVKVEFGIRFDAEAGAVIARTGVEAAITVTLAWGNGSSEGAE